MSHCQRGYAGRGRARTRKCRDGNLFGHGRFMYADEERDMSRIPLRPLSTKRLGKAEIRFCLSSSATGLQPGPIGTKPIGIRVRHPGVTLMGIKREMAGRRAIPVPSRPSGAGGPEMALLRS